jgi:hypothetical protein
VRVWRLASRNARSLAALAAAGENSDASGHRARCSPRGTSSRVVLVDRDRPRVVAISAFVGGLPALASVDAEGGPTAARLVRATGARGCQASECTSGCAPGRWFCQLSPPSVERIRPPSSIPTTSRFASWGSVRSSAHARSTAAAESSNSAATAARAARRAGASSDRGRRCGTAGSARYRQYTAPSAALTASENTPGSVSAQSTQLAPASTVRRTPPSCNPGR